MKRYVFAQGVKKMQRFCTKCGAELHENARYCASCGTIVKDRDASVKATGPEIYAGREYRKNSARQTAVIALVIAAVLAVILVMILLKDTTPDDVQPVIQDDETVQQLETSTPDLPDITPGNDEQNEAPEGNKQPQPTQGNIQPEHTVLPEPVQTTPVQEAEELPYIENVSREGQPIFAGPGYDYACVSTIESAGLYTIVEEAWDYDGNLWGRLKSGVGWIDLSDSRKGNPVYFPVSTVVPKPETPVASDAEIPYVENVSRADQRIYSGPGYDYSCVNTIRKAGLYTIVEEVWDYDGNLWGRLKSGVGWIDLSDSRSAYKETYPVSANYAQHVDLPQDCISAVFDDSQYSVLIAFVANESITDVSFSIMEFGDEGFEIGEVLYTLPELAKGNAFAPQVCFYGDFTMYCLSFVDADGVRRHITVSESGRNGEICMGETYF